MAATEIHGASLRQRNVLGAIFDGLGSTRIESVVVRPFVPSFEDEDVQAPGPSGDEVAVVTEPGDQRGRWEAELLAAAFAVRSRSARLEKVAWFTCGDHHGTLEFVQAGSQPLQPQTIGRLQSDLLAAADGAMLEALDILQPLGTAIAVAVRVAEPHAFLRSNSRGFLSCLEQWRARCDGVFAEIRDGAPVPALTVGWFRHGGFGSVRGDVESSAPPLGLGRPRDRHRPRPVSHL